MLAGGLLSQSTTIVGLLAGWIAVGGFIGHVRPSLSGGSDSELRHATTIGGLVGLGFALLLVVISVVFG
jgi:hypothetical protein